VFERRISLPVLTSALLFGVGASHAIGHGNRRLSGTHHCGFCVCAGHYRRILTRKNGEFGASYHGAYVCQHRWVIDKFSDRVIQVKQSWDQVGTAAAQQLAETDRLIENFIVACLGFVTFRIVGGDTTKPGGGLARAH